MWREKPRIDIRSVPGNVLILTLIGDHDLATKPMLLAGLADAAPEAAIVIDLTRCTFVDSTVIGAILGARVPEPCNPRVCLVFPPDTSYVVRALSVVGMRDLLPVYPSVGAALEHLAARRQA
jgi:anti-sigma B factor antagonist